MNKKKLFLLFAVLSLVSCNNNDTEKPEEPVGPTPTVETKISGEYKQTFSFSDSTYTTKFKSGFNFTNGTNQALLNSYVSDQIQYVDLLSSLEISNLYSQGTTEMTHLTLGSGSYTKGKFASGTFKWNSVEKIYKIELKVQNYFNAYTNQGVDYLNVDAPAHLKLNEEDISLECNENQMPEEKTISRNFDSGITSFKLESSNARIFVNQITITWRS